jgi:hypothetical protein
MKKFVSLLLAALLCALPGCGQDAPPLEGGASGSESNSSAGAGGEQKGELPFALAVYPEYSIHPALAVNRANLTLVPLLYEPLFEVDERFQAQPVLCESSSVDESGLVWTFTLRSGVVFSEGTPLTGKAVAGILGQSPNRQIVGRMPGHIGFFAAADLMAQELADEAGSSVFDFTEPGQRIVFLKLRTPGLDW